jgi:hypothetical protein
MPTLFPDEVWKVLPFSRLSCIPFARSLRRYSSREVLPRYFLVQYAALRFLAVLLVPPGANRDLRGVKAVVCALPL